MRIRSLFLLLMLLFPVLSYAGEHDSEANLFWQKFRHAVAGNVQEVAELTGFPFEVHGPVDSAPVIRYDRKHFPPIFRRLCSQRVEVPQGGKFVEKSMLEVIKEKETLGPKDFLTSECIRINQFVFNRIKGKWLFVQAYLEE